MYKNNANGSMEKVIKQAFAYKIDNLTSQSKKWF